MMLLMLTNAEIARLLENVAVSYEILGENRFKIIAYRRAAENIEQSAIEIKDLWDNGQLQNVPGLGVTITGHLDELFRTGRVKHFDEVMSRIPAAVFQLLLIPRIGAKKAYKLVTTLKIKSSGQRAVADLKQAARNHLISVIPTFGEKSEADILAAIGSYEKGHIKEKRWALWRVDPVAQDVMVYLRKFSASLRVDVLGSLRRRVSTVGDIDIAVATDQPDAVIKYFLQYPHEKLIEKGARGASVILTGGKQLDLRVVEPASYGSMLQYFTGSKNHNIKLRSHALSVGKSLNEYGITDTKTHKKFQYRDEPNFYQALGLPWFPPEIREDRGEIEYAVKHGSLPHLVSTDDMRGDLHLHTNYDLESSHDLGVDDIVVYLKKAEQLGYEYIGFSDHNPSISRHTNKEITAIMKRRKEYYEQIYSSYTKNTQKPVRQFIMCEVDIDPDGKLALPEEAMGFVDGIIISVHSSFNLPKDQQTQRVISGLIAHQKVRIFGHPTARLISQRSGIDLDWDLIFAVCKKQDIALEINAAPQRLDLPDVLVLRATKFGVKLVVDTDAHAAEGMAAMQYGVSESRRGWAEKKDIVNTMEYNKFSDWFLRKKIVY